MRAMLSRNPLDSDTGGGGVAYLAHVGGFVAGLVLVKLFARPAAAVAPARAMRY